MHVTVPGPTCVRPASATSDHGTPKSIARILSPCSSFGPPALTTTFAWPESSHSEAHPGCDARTRSSDMTAACPTCAAILPRPMPRSVLTATDSFTSPDPPPPPPSMRAPPSRPRQIPLNRRRPPLRRRRRAALVRAQYDVVVAGGSIAGLLCAREAAARGHSVLVAEKSHEVGTPEHCGGLVSASALRELGLSPGPGEATAPVDTAAVSHPPSGGAFEVPAARQNVVVVDRRRLDAQAADQAARNGAEVLAGAEVRGMGGGDGHVVVSGRRVECTVAVDATGAQSMAALQGGRGGGGIVPCAQYVVHAPWIKKGRVEVVVDAERYPGFFAWVIPMADGVGKVGAAGTGINPGEAAGRLAAERGRHSITRKIFAPVWIGGPAESFAGEGGGGGRGGCATVRVGDAAGQAKPTTAGGIFSCGMGGVMAGRHIASFLESGDASRLSGYEAEWRGRFGAEFSRQRRARTVLSQLDNKAVGRMFRAVSREAVAEAAKSDDFDFHAAAIARLLGVRGVIGVAGSAVGAQIAGRLGRRGR